LAPYKNYSWESPSAKEIAWKRTEATKRTSIYLVKPYNLQRIFSHVA
jgi:hypothetical protein